MPNILLGMIAYKTILRLTAVLLVSVLAPVAVRGDAPEPSAPVFSALDQRYITHAVRRVLENEVGTSTHKSTPYVPPSLRDVECQIIVTLREHGLHRGGGISHRKPILEAASEAAILALDRVKRVSTVDRELLDRMTIEVEAVGEAVPFDIPGSALLSEAVLRYIEPGVDGLRVGSDQFARRLSPTEFIVRGKPAHELIESLASKVTPTADAMTDVDVERFRTAHWHERKPGGETVALHRGMVPVRLEAVTPTGLDEAVDRMVQYVRYRQQPSGRFAYAYKPSEHKYLDQDDWVAQAEATHALCAMSRRRADDKALRGAARRALQGLVRRIVDLPGVEGAGFVRTPDDRNKLGVTAMTALALTELPDRDYILKRDKLIGAMLWLQRPSGKIITAFPPADILMTQETFPGQSLVAMVEVYEERPQQRIMEAFDKAYAFYRELFIHSPSPAFAGWHVQAYARMAIHSKRNDFAEFALGMADALAAVQLDEANCQWRDKHGAFAPYHPSAVGADSAAYLLGMCDALMLARRLGDAERAAAYERCVRRAARFVMQLEFKAEEAFYVSSRRDTLGGVRAGLIDDTLRIDHCCHAISALARAREVLFPHND